MSEYESYITCMLNAIKAEGKTEPKIFAAEAEKEIEFLKTVQHIAPTGKNALQLLGEVVKNVLNDKIKSAKEKLKDGNLEWKYNGHLKQYLKQRGKIEEPPPDYDTNDQLPEDLKESDCRMSSNMRSDQAYYMQKSTDIKQKNSHIAPQSDYNSNPQKRQIAEERDRVNRTAAGKLQQPTLLSNSPSSNNQFVDRSNGQQKKEKSEGLAGRRDELQHVKQKNRDVGSKADSDRTKHASQAMQINNPDIADLSDSNRPTKIGENFSELFDNEWTEIFDLLCHELKGNEKETTEILLKVVQRHYAEGKIEVPPPDYDTNDQLPENLKEGDCGTFSSTRGDQAGYTQSDYNSNTQKHQITGERHCVDGRKAGKNQQSIPSSSPSSNNRSKASSDGQQRKEKGERLTDRGDELQHVDQINRDTGAKAEILTKKEQSDAARGQGINNEADKPVILAKKFKDLQDEQWTIAYEFLLDKMKFGDINAVTETLLNIVQDAYRFCKDEACKQIKLMETECIKVVCGGSDVASQRGSSIDTTLLKEFRRANADLAIPRLQKTFLDQTFNKYFKTQKSEELQTIVQFCNRAIEITRLMNVYDPFCLYVPNKNNE